MKKPTRTKLSLATETVRALSATDLSEVHGGVLASKVESCRPASAGVSVCNSACDTCTVSSLAL